MKNITIQLFLRGTSTARRWAKFVTFNDCNPNIDNKLIYNSHIESAYIGNNNQLYWEIKDNKPSWYILEMR